MQPFSPVLLASLLIVTAFAGCSDAPEPASVEESIDKVRVQATPDTGVVRGVVVDPAIKPVKDVHIALVCGPYTAANATNVDGVFAFEGVPPGVCTVKASKVGFHNTTQQVEVVAKVNAPVPVKILLEVDQASVPYYQEMKFEGFIECSATFVVAGLAACSTANTGNDKFIVEYIPDRPPTWSQSEMVWEGSQDVSKEMSLYWSADLTDATLLDNWEAAHGTSPLLNTANATRGAEVGLGTNISLMIRVFNRHNEGTSPEDNAEDPTDGDDCYERPRLGGCFYGAGATANQEFTVFTHIFYGYEPTEGWRFTNDQNVPAAPQ